MPLGLPSLRSTILATAVLSSAVLACDHRADPACTELDPVLDVLPPPEVIPLPEAVSGLSAVVDPTPRCELRPPSFEVEVLDDVEYGDQHERQRMTAYLPVGLTNAPAVVFVHGGSWWYGSRDDFADRAHYFAERGIAAFTIDYALATEDQPSFPQNVQDVACASRFVKSSAEAFGIDPRSMAAYGASAGGQLAAMLGVLDGDEALLDGACGDPAVSPKVRVVMDYFGYVDLEAAAAIDPEDARVTMMTGATWDENPELWRAASPGRYVDAGDAVFVIGHGTSDPVVRPEISTTFAERLREAGVPSVIISIEGARHGFHGQPDLDGQVRCAFEPLADLLLLG